MFLLHAGGHTRLRHKFLLVERVLPDAMLTFAFKVQLAFLGCQVLTRGARLGKSCTAIISCLLIFLLVNEFGQPHLLSHL